jgi:hypothetical protein
MCKLYSVGIMIISILFELNNIQLVILDGGKCIVKMWQMSCIDSYVVKRYI